MRKEILGGIPNDGAKAIKAFAAQNSDNALKTKPKVRATSPFRSQFTSPSLHGLGWEHQG